MADLIERQAAIDALKNEQAHYAHEDGMEIFYEYNHAIKALKNLPSAQPTTVTNMDDLISKKEAIEHLKNHLAEKIKELAEELLNEEPSVQLFLHPRWDELKGVPVVRCKDCVYRTIYPNSDHHYWCVQWDSTVSYDNGYCYRGRKNEDG